MTTSRDSHSDSEGGSPLVRAPGTDLPDVGRYVSALYRHSQRFLGPRLEPYGLGSGQYVFLRHLMDEDGLSQEQLSARLGVDKATTARAVARLEGLDYVRRVCDECDRRVNRVFLTPRGEEMRPVLQAILADWLGVMMEGLSPDEQREAFRLITTMTANAMRASIDPGP